MNTLKSNFHKLSAVAIGLSLLFSVNANAGTNPPTIDEYFYGGGGEFVVHTDSDPVFGFAVANDTASFSSVDSGLFSWQTEIVDEATWDAGLYFDGGSGYQAETWGIPDTSTMTFASVFGPGASQAIVYWAGDLLGVPEPLVPFTSTGGFMFEATLPASPFIAFGDGYVFETGLMTNEISAVPLPAAVWLFGSALLGLFGFARRR